MDARTERREEMNPLMEEETTNSDSGPLIELQSTGSSSNQDNNNNSQEIPSDSSTNEGESQEVGEFLAQRESVAHERNGETTYTIEAFSSSGASGVTRILRNQRNNPVWRRTIYFEMFWLIITSFILVFSLLSYNHKHPHPLPPPENTVIDRYYNTQTTASTEFATFATVGHSKHPSVTETPPYKIHKEEKKCNGEDMRIVHWAIVHVGLQICMLALMAFNQWMLPKSDTEVITERRLKNIMSLYILGRFSHMLWLVWALLGIIWTFESRVCKAELGMVYSVCFIISICHLVAFCIPLLFCCCSLPIGFLIWCFCPSYLNRQQKTKKASKKQIKKHTTSIKYKPFDESAATSMDSYSIRKEDANCAICLGDYEEGEELRFLHCKHHFHGECVTEWLQQNKTCPMCKKPIDGEEEKETPRNNNTENSDILHETIDGTHTFVV